MFWLKVLSAMCLFRLVRLTVFAPLGALFLTCLAAHGAPPLARSKLKADVQDVVKDRFVPAPYAGQKIEGLLGERMRVNLEERLLKVNEQVLLAGFKRRPDVQTWIGEHAAKFIHAASNTVAYTNNAQLRAKLDRTVREIIATHDLTFWQPPLDRQKHLPGAEGLVSAECARAPYSNAPTDTAPSRKAMP